MEGKKNRTKRSLKEMQEDLKKINEAYTEDITTLKELSNKVGMEYQKFIYTLKYFPEAFDTLKQQLAQNKESKKQKKDEKKSEKVVVVDVQTVVFCSDIVNILTCQYKGVTKIFVKGTLDALRISKKANNQAGKNSVRIIDLLYSNPTEYKTIPVEKGIGYVESIINYCREHSNSVLLTADKLKCIEVRMYGRDYTLLQAVIESEEIQNEHRITTLNSATIINGNLEIKNLQTSKRIMEIYRKGNKIEPIKNKIELQLGDDIFLCSFKKINYFTFIHYRVIKKANQNNVRCIFSKRIYTSEQINYLPEAYRAFVSKCSEKYADFKLVN